MKLKLIFCIIFLHLLSISFLSSGNCQETINLTTYYPSPFGTYDRLRLIPRADLAAPCDIGILYVDMSGTLHYCTDNGSGQGEWSSALPTAWTQTGDDIFPTQTGTNPNLSVGIGTTSPQYLFDVTNPSDNSYRMFFDSVKGALRAGQVTGNQWDDANVGRWSMAFGKDTLASGDYSLAMGNQAQAQNTSAVALGTNALASATGSVAIGKDTVSSGDNAVAIGDGALASGQRAVAIGNSVVASGTDSVAVGSFVQSQAVQAVAMGRKMIVNGDYSIGIGIDDTQRTITQAHVFSIMGGDVGIGTKFASNQLELEYTRNNGTAMVINKADDEDADMLVFNSGGSPFAKIEGMPQESVRFLTTGATDFKLGGNDQEWMIIKADGKVGIGTSSPERFVHIVSEDLNIPSDQLIPGSQMVVEGDKTTMLLYSSISVPQMGSGIFLPEVDSGGNIQNLWAVLRESNSLLGTGCFYIGYKTEYPPVPPLGYLVITKDGKVGMGIKGSSWQQQLPVHPLEIGNGAYSDGVTWFDASSRKYKEDIKQINLQESLAAFRALKPVTFQYKETEDGVHPGFISEDMPGLVATEKGKGLSPMDIAALLTRVVQYQRQEIQELKRRINKK